MFVKYVCVLCVYDSYFPDLSRNLMEHTKQPLVSVLDTQTLPARKPFDQMVNAGFFKLQNAKPGFLA